MSLLAQPECAIVHLDDCREDLLVFQQALLRTGVPVRVHPFLVADMAVAWLQRKPPFHQDEGIPAPSVFLCDYNLGTTRGADIVPLVRAEPLCAGISIIMLSGAADEHAVEISYRAGANHFLQKPFTAARMDAFARALYNCAIGGNFAALMRLQEYRVVPGP